MHPLISHYLHDFFEASNQCYNENLEINWPISNTQSKSSWTLVSIGKLVWSRPGSWYRMYPHLLECLHDFSEACSQCYNGIIEINWIIEKNWSITAQISISVGPSARSRPPHLLECLRNLCEAFSHYSEITETKSPFSSKIKIPIWKFHMF